MLSEESKVDAGVATIASGSDSPPESKAAEEPAIESRSAAVMSGENLERAPGSPAPATTLTSSAKDANADAERIRLWMDTKGWMNEVCKRLQLSLEEASLRASVKDKSTFEQWYLTGKPHDVTRLLRVWVKSLIKDAQLAAAAANPPATGAAADWEGEGGDWLSAGEKRKRAGSALARTNTREPVAYVKDGKTF